MPALNFPNNPALNDIYHANGSSWKWDGDRWRRIADPGSQGVIGAQGAQGAQGHQGVAGAQGAQGHQGVQGAQGRQGAQGVQGAAGAVGAQGTQGVQGAAGTVGSQGAQGHQGVQGATGSAGAQGAPGTATINNNANDRLITGSDTAGELNAEADITFDGTKLKLNDNKRIDFGSNNDLKISHTNSLSGQNDSNSTSILDGGDWASYIQETGTGPLIFKTDGGPGTGAYQFYDAGWRPILKLFSGTSARAALYHSGSEKLITDAGGISITGGIKDKDGELGTSGQVLSSTGTQLNWVANTAGAQGAQGHQGVQGAEGVFGGASFEYDFATATTMQDPGTGALRLNNSTQNSATAIALDHQDVNGTDISTYLATIDASTSTIKGHVKITKKDDSSKFILATISAEVDQTGWHQVTIGVVGSSANSPFSNADDIIVTFARTGDKGEVGAQGAQGRQGSPGAQGAQGHQGVQGATGAQGHQGHQGRQGAQGHQGVQGSTGSGGGAGAQGAQGHQGHQGRQGATGNTGAQGVQGAAAAGTNGKILQVVSTTLTSKSSYTVGNGSYSTVSNFSAAITPSSSSNKILVIVNIGGMSIDYSRAVGASLAVNGSLISGAKGAFAAAVGYPFQTYYEQAVSFSYLHSPGSTSQQTYTVQVNHSHSGNRTIYFNTSDSEERTCASTITAMEVD